MKLIKKAFTFLAVALMVISLNACNSVDNAKSMSADIESTTNVDELEVFPKFQGTDFEGNAVDESLFSNNAVTVLNFWFNGCSACVDEMPALEKFNEALKEKGAELVGVNVDIENKGNTLEEAKDIVAKQGASYRNIIIQGGDEANAYLSKMMVFPTTILIDRNGNVIGECITGNIDGKETLASIMQVVDDALEAEK